MIVAAVLLKTQQLQEIHDVCEHVYVLYILFIYKNTRYSIKKLQINSYSHSSKYINLFSQYLVLLTGTPRIIKSYFLQSWYSRVPHYAGQPKQLCASQGRLRVCRETRLSYFSFNDRNHYRLLSTFCQNLSLKQLILNGLRFSQPTC